jgi:hypothetical protein
MNVFLSPKKIRLLEQPLNRRDEGRKGGREEQRERYTLRWHVLVSYSHILKHCIFSHSSGNKNCTSEAKFSCLLP